MSAMKDNHAVSHQKKSIEKLFIRTEKKTYIFEMTHLACNKNFKIKYEENQHSLFAYCEVNGVNECNFSQYQTLNDDLEDVSLDDQILKCEGSEVRIQNMSDNTKPDNRCELRFQKCDDNFENCVDLPIPNSRMNYIMKSNWGFAWEGNNIQIIQPEDCVEYQYFSCKVGNDSFGGVGGVGEFDSLITTDLHSDSNKKIQIKNIDNTYDYILCYQPQYVYPTGSVLVPDEADAINEHIDNGRWSHHGQCEMGDVVNGSPCADRALPDNRYASSSG